MSADSDFKEWFTKERRELEANEPATFTDSDEWLMKKGFLVGRKSLEHKLAEAERRLSDYDKEFEKAFYGDETPASLLKKIQTAQNFAFEAERKLEVAKKALENVKETLFDDGHPVGIISKMVNEAEIALAELAKDKE